MGGQPARVRIAIAACLAVVVGLAAILLLDRDGAATRASDDLVMLALSTYAAVCAVVAARRADGSLRRAWRTMAGAIVVWTIGDLVWLLCDLVLHLNPPVPSPADVFYLTFAVLAAAAMAQLPTTSTRPSRLRLILDAATVALCLFLLAWVLALNAVYDDYRADKIALSVALLYPVLDLVALTVAKKE